MNAKPARTGPSERRVAFLAYTDASLLDIAGPLQVFSDANQVLGHNAYTTPLASLHGGPVETATGVVLTTQRLAGIGLDEPDTVWIAGGPGARAARRDPRLVAGLQRASERCGRMVASAGGAFLLAEAGLLDARPCTTHWSEHDALSRDYPELALTRELVEIGCPRVWTCAGGSASLDLALALVESDHGRSLALELARRHLVYPNRPGDQGQFAPTGRPAPRLAGGRFDALHLWLADNLTADLRVEALAARCGMSPRNFARLYAEETGRTPARAVEEARLKAAMALLENDAASVREVAIKAGFGSDERMRRSFLRAHGLSPQAWRERFSLETA
ncbi:GlxA family transcriptional regulator [Maricaulis sp. CAU 1757]